jgi:hypothetical protein
MSRKEDKVQNETPAFTFDQVLEMVAQWPVEQQEMLFDVLRRRQIAIRRKEIAQNVRETRAAYRQGELQAESASDAIDHLRTLLAEEV